METLLKNAQVRIVLAKEGAYKFENLDSKTLRVPEKTKFVSKGPYRHQGDGAVYLGQWS
jgi:hypothetical protein